VTKTREGAVRSGIRSTTCLNRLIAPTPAGTRRAIILMTDGDDTVSVIKHSEASDLAVKAETAIYAIGIGDRKNYDVDEKDLRKLAEQSGGRAFFPQGGEDLSASFAQIQDELRSQYLVAYAPTNAVRDGSYRRIRVEMNNPELKKQKVRYFTGKVITRKNINPHDWNPAIIQRSINSDPRAYRRRLPFGADTYTSAGPVRAPRGTEVRPFRADASPALRKAVESGVAQTKLTRSYDPTYVKIDYPGGDVPIETGVCSDVIVRAFRQAGVDLQKEVHEDMKLAFAVYPQKWGLPGPDSNIDHRRVSNLMKYFERQGKSLPITQNPDDYQPGDVVSWVLGQGGPTHIGLVTNIYSPASERYLIVHNIGGGTQLEDVVFAWPITGHYRYF